ncbi:19976_t:CDS:2 [Funneliformis geosporum]|uniref:8229_t:CDS:1 n=1 Tax=Funneliformis geosporum TaxID=1117311 RepID=A0A9W4SUB6_9GLOM|nr:8229_t:CDS:2 [Funneliformis geosporum]CAI2181830.1 19976_t:CDS:2 [Funneliformis geosporum]
MSLAFAIALIVLITEFILWFGYSQIASLAYGIYLNAFEKERIQKQRKIKRDILNVKHDLARTSSQDQFAKWAKLRRKLDSKMSELDKITTSLGYLKTSFEIKFTTFLWVFSNGMQFFMVLWYRSSPVFYLPQDWFSPISWIFSLPFAPSGSVSVPFWFFICRKFSKKVIQTSKDAVPLYHSYAPESLKQHGPLVIQWCIINIQKFTPIVVQWVNTKARTLCNVIIEKAKPVANTKPFSTNNASVASTSKEEDHINRTETKEKNEKVSASG